MLDDNIVIIEIRHKFVNLIPAIEVVHWVAPAGASLE